MTQASSIITDAYRESNLIALGTTPTTAEQTEALRRLNNILSALFDHEIGCKFSDLAVGTTAEQLELPLYTESNRPAANTRLVIRSSQAETIYLPATPKDGNRIAVVDPLNLLSTYNVTLDGNGRAIESAASVVLSTNGVSKQWMYRADTGNWLPITSLADVDAEMPLPSLFDDYFIGALAVRLNPRYGRETDPTTMAIRQDLLRKMRARYQQMIQMPSELSLWVNPWRYDGMNDFARGY